jgi:hypothetical protein
MGIDKHEICNQPIGSLAGVADLPNGPVLLLFYQYQYAYHANGSTIHSKMIQLMDTFRREGGFWPPQASTYHHGGKCS